MAQDQHPAVQQLETQLEQIRERLARKEPRGRGWWLTLTGLSLGALAGGALAYALRSREEEAAYLPPPPPTPIRRDDAITLKPAQAPAAAPAQTTEDAPIELKTPALPSTPEQGGTPATADEAPETEKAPEAAEEIAAAVSTGAPLMAEPETAAEEAPQPQDTTEAEPATTETPEQAEAVSAEAEEATETSTEESQANEPHPEHAGAVLPVDTTCPASHPIKGNLSRNSVLIFHVPGSNNYERTHPEACFATEADAEAAGFRKAKS